MTQHLLRVCLRAILILAGVCAPLVCAAEVARFSGKGDAISYEAASGLLPTEQKSSAYSASDLGDGQLAISPEPALITKDNDATQDGRYYWLPRAATQQAIGEGGGITLTVKCSIAKSTGHDAATSVRVFIPGGGVTFGPLTKDVHRAGYQNVIESGRQIGFSFISDGVHHDQDEVLLLDFGPQGPHRVLGRIRTSVDAMQSYVLVIPPAAGNAADSSVVLSCENDPQRTVSAKLSEFGPNAAVNDFGLVFGHMTGGGVAEASWQEIRLEGAGGRTSKRPCDEQPMVRTIDNRKQLFLDDWIIAHTDHLVRQQGTPVKSPRNPVIRRDRPWEASRCELYGSSIWLPERKQLQLFYSATKQPYDARLAYAVSADYGETWTKPKLAVVPWEGEPSNIVWLGRYWAHGPTVLFDRQESAPKKRYKLLVTAADVNPEKLDQGPRGMDAAFSPDGIHWTPAANNPVIPDFVSDTGNCVIWDNRDHKYRVYVRLRTNQGRAVGLCESTDFLHWTVPQMVYWPTAEDRQNRQEFYGMSVTPYGDLDIALVWMFPAVPSTTDMKSDTPVTWPELAVSRDGVHWTRPFAGEAFLPLGPKGAFDARQIRPASSMSVLPDRIVIMYSGSPNAHVAGHLWDIGEAKLRLDGFAALTAGAEEGTLLTQPLRFPKGRLIVNADVEDDGYVRVEACDFNGQALPNYSKDLCRGIKADSPAAAVSWHDRDSLDESADTGTRLRFTMKNARLYSLQVDPSNATSR